MTIQPCFYHSIYRSLSEVYVSIFVRQTKNITISLTYIVTSSQLFNSLSKKTLPTININYLTTKFIPIINYEFLFSQYMLSDIFFFPIYPKNRSGRIGCHMTGGDRCRHADPSSMMPRKV